MARRIDASEHLMDDGITLVTIAVKPMAMKKLAEQADETGESVGQVCEDLVHEALRVWD